MSDQIHDLFIAEAHELIADLEKALLALELNLENPESISTIFRAMHTLKGAAGMFGFDSVGQITHQLESIYQDIRDGQRPMDHNVLKTSLGTLDHLRNLMDDPGLENETVHQRHEELILEIATIAFVEQATDENKETVIDKKTQEISSTYYVYLLPKPHLLRNGSNTLYLVEDLLALGNGIAIPFFHQLPALDKIVPSDSYLGYEVVLATSRQEADIQEVFMFVEGDCEIKITRLATSDLLKNQTAHKKLFKDHDFLKPKGYQTILSALFPHPAGKIEAKNESFKSNTTSIRVSSDRLDELMNLVSEMVTTQARLSMFANINVDTELAGIAENVEKITRRLRDNAFSMSLVPLENLLVRFQRLVRDLSKELNKEIEFKTTGTETEIDKSIIEKLTDPLLHLLRNSIDHGVEKADVRKAAGKPAQGTVFVRSYYSGANVVIEIGDDGNGIDAAKVREKAIAKGVIDPSADLSEKEIINLIFLPGFSTAAKVTAVSGRGVGLDVVHRNIMDLRGEIEVNSLPGKGTTFIIKLPLTLSIVDGLRVKIGNTDFVLPLTAVAKCYEVKTSTLDDSFNHWTTLEGNKIPFLYLREAFAITESKPVLSQIIKVPFENSHVGIVVDKIEGEYQAVLKPLGHLFLKQDEFSGSTILGDGSVALVIDPNKIIRKLSEEHRLQIKTNQ